MSEPGMTTCAAPGCENPVVRRPRGRPAIYCSPACRSTRRRSGGILVVEVDHEPVPDNGRPAGRVWLVRLRREGRAVVIAAELGRPSADHLATQITDLLGPRREAKGAAID